MIIDGVEYLTVIQAAERTGYDPEHLRKLLRAGKVKSIEVDERKRLVAVTAIEEYQAEKPQRKPHEN